jgi:hypothetical protein
METEMQNPPPAAPLTLAAVREKNPNEGLLEGRIVKIHILWEVFAVAEARRAAMYQQLGRKVAHKSALYRAHAAFAERYERWLRMALDLSWIICIRPSVIPPISRKIAAFVIRAERAQDKKAGRCCCHLCAANRDAEA